MCGSTSVPASLEAFIDYIRAGFHAAPSSQDAMFPASDMYPDCLKDGVTKNIVSGYRQPVYVTYDIPETAEPGEYSGTVTFSGRMDGKDFTIEKEIRAKVYDVTVPEQTFLAINQHDHRGLSYMANGERVDLFSERYWDLMKVLLNSMRDHRLNVYWMTYLPDYIRMALNDGVWSFDFTDFDRTVEMFIKEGGLKRIAGGHLAWRPTGEWLEAFEIGMPNGGTMPLDSPEAQNWLDQFIPALYDHLREKGWTDIYLQHIADEPVDGLPAQSYIRIAESVMRCSPAALPMLSMYGFPNWTISTRIMSSIWTGRISETRCGSIPAVIPRAIMQTVSWSFRSSRPVSFIGSVSSTRLPAICTGVSTGIGTRPWRISLLKVLCLEETCSFPIRGTGRYTVP